jgi:hypothetical protein
MGRQSASKKAKVKAANKHSAAIEEATKLRKAAIKRMNEALKAKFEAIETQVQTLQSENIVFYYGLGEIVREIQNDSGRYVGSDGTSGMDLLEDAMATQKRTLRKCAAFVQAYTRSEMRALIELCNTETAYTLHWGHVSYLLTLTDKEERTKFAYEAVTRMWDPSMLHERIRKAKGKSSGHGRKHTLPVTVEKQVRQIRDLSRTWMGKQNDVWNGSEVNVFTNVLNAGNKQITPELQDYLLEIRELMIEIADAAHQDERHAEAAIAHVRKVLEDRAATTVGKPRGAAPQREIEIANAG